MDVKAAIRRTRLPFVASLFLAVLLGAPTAAAAVEPVRAPAVAAPCASSTATEPSPEPIIVDPESTPVPAAQAVTLPATPALRDQAVRAARTPRAPPQR